MSIQTFFTVTSLQYNNMSVSPSSNVSFKRPANLLVIGGAGYIGSAVTFRALTQTNMNVTVVDRLLYGGSSLFRMFSFGDRFNFIGRDIRDLDLDELIKGFDYGKFRFVCWWV